MLMEELDLWPRRLYDTKPVKAKADVPHVAIIGGGLSGIGLGVYLRRLAYRSSSMRIILGPGGTWYDNRYPGCGVDTTTHLYLLSFALNSVLDALLQQTGRADGLHRFLHRSIRSASAYQL